MAKKGLIKTIEKQWDLLGLLQDLAAEDWVHTEPGRADRLHWIGGYHIIEDLAKDAYSEKKWHYAASEGLVHELVDEYLEALVETLKDLTGSKSYADVLFRRNLYTTIENNDVFLGEHKYVPATRPRGGGTLSGAELGMAQGLAWSGTIEDVPVEVVYTRHFLDRFYKDEPGRPAASRSVREDEVLDVIVDALPEIVENWMSVWDFEGVIKSSAFNLNMSFTTSTEPEGMKLIMKNMMIKERYGVSPATYEFQVAGRRKAVTVEISKVLGRPRV